MYIPLVSWGGTYAHDIVQDAADALHQWQKRHRKQAFIASLSLKMALLSLPIVAVPVSAAPKQVHEHPVVEVQLSKSPVVFESGQAQIVPKPGQSNAAIETEKRRNASIAQQRFVTATVTDRLDATPEPSLTDLRTLYAEAGEKFGVPAPLIEAVHQVESGKSWNTAKRSGAGAVGPMQFLPSTFRTYCVRTGQGCDITNAEHSIYAASALLSANYNGSWDHALLAYNHSDSYVRKVKAIANELGANL